MFPKGFFGVVRFLCPVGPGPMCLSCVFPVFGPFKFTIFYRLRVTIPVFSLLGLVLVFGLVVCVGVIGLLVGVGEIRLPRYPLGRLRRTQPATDGGCCWVVVVGWGRVVRPIWSRVRACCGTVAYNACSDIYLVCGSWGGGSFRDLFWMGCAPSSGARNPVK